MRTCYLLLAGIILSTSSFAQSPPERKLVWSDEFNYQGLPDSSKWGYDVGGHGWGNNEQQFYTRADPSNVAVKEGSLHITARKKADGGYTSARMVSKNKGDWTYGRIEVRAKLPAGRGIWPAIWMLPTDWAYGGWPESGEIDIMEFVGYMPDSVFFSIHTQSYNHSIGTQKTRGIYLKDTDKDFHVYAIDWSKERIIFLLDNREVFRFSKEAGDHKVWPFDKRFHLLLNIAVGGNWGGQKGIDDSIFPQAMQIDYVRVYQ
ncbi:glycoside hydrolase family 16 protein [Flavihumibacter rivuli]|uniref:glycoside hydrolase family 16 protein n=1 Tax=Flavihumibacter rivuli TaxID=2838156 RepID=UPI001BDE2D17|nr:glycoside hydrolase family 16 protein [Flavihumibacter rivuli]ULQ57191.1 glycoside hydrolase family 16 protein [Flavihumibacter rivuli]